MNNKLWSFSLKFPNFQLQVLCSTKTVFYSSVKNRAEQNQIVTKLRLAMDLQQTSQLKQCVIYISYHSTIVKANNYINNNDILNEYHYHLPLDNWQSWS